MTERLSDDLLREKIIAELREWVEPEDDGIFCQIADRILFIVRAVGPVMPERPSEAVAHAMMDDLAFSQIGEGAKTAGGKVLCKSLYRTARAALAMKREASSTCFAEAPIVKTDLQRGCEIGRERMTERLSDERLRTLATWDAVLRSPEERIEMARELLALRTAGPVMPETPSEAVWGKIVAGVVDKHIVPNGRIADVYIAIRAALARGQGAMTARERGVR